MKTAFRIALVLAFALSLFGISTASAQQGGLTFTSGVQVVNLSTSTANITLYFYDQTTGTQAGSVTDTIAAGSSKTYFPLSGVNPGFNGSMVIESDVQVAAIANLITPSGQAFSAATTGFSAGATTFNLPLVMCNNSGFNTFFNVQNAGATDAHITINYKPGSNGVAQSETATIKSGAAKSFDQATGSSTVNCSTLKDATGKFIGGATITSDIPVVATVMQLNTTSFQILMGYNGFATGSSTVNLPLIMANNSSFYTGIQIQNSGNTATNVTVTYSPNTTGSFNPTPDTCANLAAGASCTLIQQGGKWGTNKYIGGATITNDGNQPLVAIVNQVSLGTPNVFGPEGTAYEGFDPATATSKVSAPLIMANNSGYYTGIQVQNTNTSGTCPVNIHYSTNVAPGGTFAPVDENFTLAGGASKTIIQSGGPANNGGSNDWNGKGKYVGSAEITATGCNLVSIINEVSISTGDRYFTYDGFNH